MRKFVLTLTGAALAALLFYARRIEPDWLQVRYVPLKLPQLDKAFHGYMIAQIGDIHMGSWMTRARLQAAVDLINSLRPDLIAITGDFVDRMALFVEDDLME